MAALNTSNQRIMDMALGNFKDNMPATGTFIWVDVRDVALAHVLAMEVPEAGGKRFFTTAGHFSNNEIRDIIRKNFPEYAENLPGDDQTAGGYPESGVFKVDNSRTIEILGLKYRSLEESVVETVRSLKSIK
jgi:nucleoside-diphosphate-sugar epimerase